MDQELYNQQQLKKTSHTVKHFTKKLFKNSVKRESPKMKDEFLVTVLMVSCWLGAVNLQRVVPGVNPNHYVSIPVF